MTDWVVLWDWVMIAVRWLHVITAIAWIGSSFYFIALDLGLRKPETLPEGVSGEEWQVHGGGFYHIQKYMVAPAHMPEHLIWFKWESYMTWLSGFAMMFLVYYMGANLFLVDPSVMDLAPWQAIGISMGSLALGWVMYDQICKSRFGDDNTRLMIGLYVILVLMAWGYVHVFSGRAAMLHLGAFTATVMSGNVFFVIIPNQKVVVADLIAGRTPDPKYGKIAKQRSTHNNYLTLPVLFLMLSNHYPLIFATEYNWIIASLVFLMGVTIRHWFNTRHAGRGNPHWTWLVTVILFLIIAWLSTAPMRHAPEQARLEGPAVTFAAAKGFDEVVSIVQTRCSMCHAREPAYEGISHAPKGVVLETPSDVAREAVRIYTQAGLTHAMPPANLSFMEQGERDAIVKWFRGAANPPGITG